MFCNKQNPYIRMNGKPWLRRSVVAFLDILGFVDFMRDSIQRRKEHQSLRALTNAFEQSMDWMRPSRSNVSTEKDLFALRTFTDNVVIGFPIEKHDSEGPLGMVVGKVALFQLEMLLSGFFVRGALTVGNVYIGSEFVYGNGLLEAYETERDLARDPRIVLAKSAYKDLATHINYYGIPEESPQYHEWLQDADNQLFLNYLQILFDEAEHDEKMMRNVIARHQSVIKGKLSAHRPRPALWNKYAWVARYHNYFCDCHRDLFEKEKIDADELYLGPARIF